MEDKPLSEDAQAIAEAQASEDAVLMAALQKRTEASKAILADVKAARPRMSRSERRAQVKMYARVLAATERQEPVVNSTIIPKAKRRRRKGGR